MSHHFLVGVVLMSACSILMINADGKGSESDPDKTRFMNSVDELLGKLPSFQQVLVNNDPKNDNGTNSENTGTEKIKITNDVGETLSNLVDLQKKYPQYEKDPEVQQKLRKVQDVFNSLLNN